mmetsp:Transcript_25905/g.70225  ORF Transcript_25905/g.70225 Transcript_25905/m.70225 type:complete len:168 (-) Transcript_25905:1343-1846(-)
MCPWAPFPSGPPPAPGKTTIPCPLDMSLLSLDLNEARPLLLIPPKATASISPSAPPSGAPRLQLPGGQRTLCLHMLGPPGRPERSRMAYLDRLRHRTAGPVDGRCGQQLGSMQTGTQAPQQQAATSGLGAAPQGNNRRGSSRGSKRSSSSKEGVSREGVSKGPAYLT